MVCATMANGNLHIKKKDFAPADFMPWLAKPKKKQTPEDMLAVVQMLNVAFGGEVVH